MERRYANNSNNGFTTTIVPMGDHKGIIPQTISRIFTFTFDAAPPWLGYSAWLYDTRIYTTSNFAIVR